MSKIKEDRFNPLNSTQLVPQGNYFLILKKLYENGKFPKVLMLSGEKGGGKFTLIFHLINYFFTHQSKENPYDLKKFKINPNNTFYKNILLNINENFNYIGNKDYKKVNIEMIRDIKKKLNTSSLNNLPRFTILDDADLLNVNSANALLKLIEEPSNSNYFILINNKRKKILETIKSRSLEVKIFINSINKKNVLDQLLKRFDINMDNYIYFIYKTTPGTFIRVCDCLYNLNFDNGNTLYNSTEILLDKFKKDKDPIYLETIKFLLDLNIERSFRNKNNNFLQLGLFKNKITRLLFEFENFNLSKGSVLQSFNSLPEYG